MSLLSNAKWNSFSQFFKIIIQVVNLVYLAKIIPPADYGIMAMAAVVTNLAVLVRDLGTSAAIIQKKQLTEELKNTIFWLNSIMGMVICVIICFSSQWIAELYSQPKLGNVLLLISVIFPLSSCAAAHLALMERESEFKKISFIEVSSSLTSVIIAVIMAHMGYGVYSLVGQAITLNLMSAVQFWISSKWSPSVKRFINLSELKQIFSFSANLSLFNLINYISRNGDSFIIGRYMSSVILGNYNLAYRIMLFPLQSLTFVASRSLYPILSKYQDDNKKILSTYNECVFIIVLITAPLMAGIAILSEPFIHIVFGAQWKITADVLKWLAPTAIIQSVLSTTGAVFSAKGRTDVLLKLGILGTVLQFGAFLIGVNFSITTFAFCYLIANVLNFFPVMYALLYLLSGQLSSFLYKLLPILLSTLFMLFIVKVIDTFLYSISNITSYGMLFLFAVVGFLSYNISLLILSKKIRVFMLNVCKK
ncbi:MULTISPECIES: lipopolysaccharide biosynthesis protein [Klebsiella pneumoniae complex]|uniref:lipopolysaccharide biosynthesis protein n=1 Tax=Klebsiella pneumoniae complex TaxID=3390273 RepID=UPI0021A612A3|nr:lipopolysaccharide biosynthesis protein [Klebsiella variicola]UWS45723.1 lipopolysaccharide biosynthesis protein [Klebsiella variicola]HDH1530274.1 lipopolysaccharide biosynthesis protein [Klebsiella quasipneumoniae subsp. similipneumoniae]